MHIEFEDESTLGIASAYKNYDFGSGIATISIVFSGSTSEDDVMQKDFSKFKIVRGGMDDVEFDGCTAGVLRTEIDSGSTTLSIDLSISGR